MVENYDEYYKILWAFAWRRDSEWTCKYFYYVSVDKALNWKYCWPKTVLSSHIMLHHSL